EFDPVQAGRGQGAQDGGQQGGGGGDDEAVGRGAGPFVRMEQTLVPAQRERLDRIEQQRALVERQRHDHQDRQQQEQQDQRAQDAQRVVPGAFAGGQV